MPTASSRTPPQLALWALAHTDNLNVLGGLLRAFRSSGPARRRRRPSLTRLATKAKTLGVAITLELNGAVTVRADNTADPTINEWDAELIHGKH
jgi:hypothetical protein